ncbi:MAG: PLP-dependent aminotransferase family protein, partial [Ectothiorhodospiraceae bacterium]
QLGLRHVGLPLDDHGIVPEAFENACQQHAPRALYCVPNQNNPTTAAMPLQRRQSIVEIAQRHGVVLIEDDVNLIDPSERPPALVELAPDRVVHVSSCSKTLAEGLRVGIVRPPVSLREAMGNALRSQCWMAPPLMGEVACRWIHSGVAAELARTQREEIGARQALVDRVFAGRSYASQPYGFNVWLRLPEPWRASAFVDRCRERGVVIKTGEPFAVGSYPVPQAVRICVSAAPSREALRVGLESIRAVLEEVPSVSLSVL